MGSKAPRSFTVVASGDVLLHEGVSEQARRDGGGALDYRKIMRSVKPVISGADLAICHLETPLAPPRGPFHGYPVFSVPPQIVPALADLGYDTCSTASNHTLDQGTAGVGRTLRALDAAGIRHTGSARSAAEAARTNLLSVAGVPVAQLSYTYGFNGFRLPAGRPWTANQISVPRILAEARRARRAGAKAVIVSLHWGTEYRHAPNAMQVKVARALLASPAVDLIVGHHAHVVQPIGRASNGEYVAYGMGNLLAGQIGRDKNEGVITRFTFTRSGRGYKVTKAEFVPTLIEAPGGRVRLYDVLAELRRTDLSTARRTMLGRVAARTASIVRSRGVAVPFAGPPERATP
ncbi:CapA family protein [Actinocorallia longicatena]|uniref:CapA family protein n=2 Tax=Actinocorallia longicatena TaxID=111803 RepID=A0ABP6QDW9_9ACTN